MLNVQLHILGNFISKATKYGDTSRYGVHSRIKLTYEALDSESLIKSEIQGRKGRMVISGMPKLESKATIATKNTFLVCANGNVAGRIRRVVGSLLDDRIRLEELDFRPYDSFGMR